MGTAKAIDEQISDYLGLLNEKQKEAVLTVVKTFVGDDEYDDDLKKEFDARFEAYQNGEMLISEAEAGQKIKSILEQDGSF